MSIDFLSNTLVCLEQPKILGERLVTMNPIQGDARASRDAWTGTGCVLSPVQASKPGGIFEFKRHFATFQYRICQPTVDLAPSWPAL